MVFILVFKYLYKLFLKKNIMISIARKVKLDDWVLEILTHPLTKKKILIDQTNKIDGILDLRNPLTKYSDFNKWKKSQNEFENWVINDKEYKFSKNYNYRKEIIQVKPVYDHFKIKGKILDVGGHIGTLREFLDNNDKYISVDPFIGCLKYVSLDKFNAYKCLNKNLNFVYANAEKLPFKSNSFDYVHMRSVIDHFLDINLSLKEANRVLVCEGKILIGTYVLGGKYGKIPIKNKIKEFIRKILLYFGFERYRDHHMIHPTLNYLKKLVTDNGFEINDIYWQPYWNNQVCYLLASKI